MTAARVEADKPPSMFVFFAPAELQSFLRLPDRFCGKVLAFKPSHRRFGLPHNSCFLSAYAVAWPGDRSNHMPTGPYKNLNILSKDLDEVEDFLCQAYAPVSVKKVGEYDRFGIDGQIAVLDDIFFEWSRSIASYEITPLTPFDSVLFNFVDSVGANYMFNGEWLGVSPGRVIGYRQAEKVEVLDRSEHITVVISDDLLIKRMSTLLDRPITHPVDFQRDAIEQCKLCGLSAFVRSLSSPPFKEFARSIKDRSNSIGDLIIDGFLLSFPNNYTDRLKLPVALTAPKHVRRAIDYIHANPGNRHSPELLAGLSSVSVRSLQYSFLNFTGQTISEYQIEHRLQRAKDEVQHRPDLSFKQISHRWGFGTQSAFAQQFRRAYGVTPSMLRRNEHRKKN